MFSLINFNKKVFKLSLIFVLVIVILTGCQSTPKDAVAKVNGDTISKTEFNKAFEMVKKGYEDQLGPDIMSQEAEKGKTVEELIKENILEVLIMEKIELKEAKKNKMTATDEEVNELIKQYKEKLGGEEEYKKFLENNNVDESYFKEMVKKEKTIEKYREDYINKTEVTDEEAKKFFDENKDAYEVVKASHILVETEEEAKNILERIEKGEDFKALAKEKSKDEGSAKEGGDLGYFTKDKMVPEFSKVAFSLKPGEVSEVVKSQYGYHIIKVEDKIDKYDKANDEMKDEIVQGIKVTRFQEHLEKMRDEAKVDIYTEENKKSEDKSDDKKDNEKKEDKKAS